MRGGPAPQLRVPCLQGMILQISGSLPSLSGMEMACDYGNSIRTVARVPGPAFDNQIAYCNLLPKDQFPPFPSHQGKLFIHKAVGTPVSGSSGAQPRGDVMVDLRHGGPDITASDVTGDSLHPCPSLLGSPDPFQTM